MIKITSALIQDWERLYRSNFVNSLTGFKSVSLVGTIGQTGIPNLAVFSSLVHIGSNPALVGFINRPLTPSMHTLPNIQASKIYTINHIHPSFLPLAHQTSAKYPTGVSEFDMVGLHPEFQENIVAPFVRESRVKYALELQEIIPIRSNDTSLVIGRIMEVLLEKDIIQQDGFISLDRSGSVCSNGNDGYYQTSLIRRFQYARPGLPVQINDTHE